MHTVNSAAQRLNALHGVFAAGNEVSAIDAGPDPLIAAFDCVNDVLQLIVESPGPVIVNRNSHVVFTDELLQAGERLLIRLRVGCDHANAELLGKLEDSFVGGVIS